MDLNDLKIDPEFEEKIPPLTEDEFLLLEQNIVADGEVLDPLIIWNNTILDGHNRYRILKKHPEIPFKTFPKEFPDKYAAIAWICRNQLGRRNLTPEQKRYLIGKQYEAEKASHGGHYVERDSETGQFTVSLQNEDLRIPERTSAKIAEESNTSRSFVERAEKYAKGVDAADEALPGIRKEILSGSIKPTQAAVAAIARAAPEDRAELAKLLNISPIQMPYISTGQYGEGLLKVGKAIVPFENKFREDTQIYKLLTSKMTDLYPEDLTQRQSIEEFYAEEPVQTVAEPVMAPESPSVAVASESDAVSYAESVEATEGVYGASEGYVEQNYGTPAQQVQEAQTPQIPNGVPDAQ